MSTDQRLGLLRLAAGLSFVFALVNHLLPPKPFALTQLMFDYSAGLTRRGLVGEVAGWVWGYQVSLAEVYALSAAITLIGALAFYHFMVRQLPSRIEASWLLIVLALNTFAFASFVGNSGYLDGLLLALTVVAVSLPVTGAGLAARLALVAVAMLVHENMLPYFSVLIGFDLWLRRRGKPYQKTLALLPVLAGFVMLAGLVLAAKMEAATAQRFAEYLTARADFWVDPAALEVSARGIAGNLALMAELRGTTKYWAWVLFDGAPLLAMSLWLIWLAGRLLRTSQERIFAGLAILAPLSLNLIAFDVVRFGVASVLTGFLLIGVVVGHRKGAAARLAAVLTWPHMLVVLVLNVNIFTIQVNIGAFHVGQFPWILLTQLKWLAP